MDAGHTDNLRESVSHEAARIICEEGFRDYRLAKEKACVQLGISHRAAMPANREVEEAVRNYLQRVIGDAFLQSLTEKRAAAVSAMTELAEFSPRLVGGVLNGTAAPDHPVQLHLFGDCVEELDRFLLERGMAFESSDKRHRYGSGRWQMTPATHFDYDGIEFEAVFFDYDGLRRAPDCPVAGQPMPRATVAQVEQLIRDSG